MQVVDARDDDDHTACYAASLRLCSQARMAGWALADIAHKCDADCGPGLRGVIDYTATFIEPGHA